jgi:outer membrane immunogenic protein
VITAILLSTTAIAGDLPSKKKTPVQPVKAVTPYNWTGAYVGLNAGLSMAPQSQKVSGINQLSLNNLTVNQSVILPTKLNKTSPLLGGGLVLGYNYQMGNFVYGAEADIMALSASKSARTALAYSSGLSPYISSSSGKISQNYLSTIRYKAGYAFDDIMVYGTAGLAMANVKTKSNFQIRDVNGFPTNQDNVWTGSKNSMRYGYSLGGGAEYAYTKNITIKAEYLYYNLGKIKYSTAPDAFTSVDQAGAYQSVKSKISGNIIRVGLNYKF